MENNIYGGDQRTKDKLEVIRRQSDRILDSILVKRPGPWKIVRDDSGCNWIPKQSTIRSRSGVKSPWII
jgi:hypothetical protein